VTAAAQLGFYKEMLLQKLRGKKAAGNVSGSTTSASSSGKKPSGKKTVALPDIKLYLWDVYRKADTGNLGKNSTSSHKNSSTSSTSSQKKFESETLIIEMPLESEAKSAGGKATRKYLRVWKQNLKTNGKTSGGNSNTKSNHTGSNHSGSNHSGVYRVDFDLNAALQYVIFQESDFVKPTRKSKKTISWKRSARKAAGGGMSSTCSSSKGGSGGSGSSCSSCASSVSGKSGKNITKGTNTAKNLSKQGKVKVAVPGAVTNYSKKPKTQWIRVNDTFDKSKAKEKFVLKELTFSSLAGKS
jgi:hypothetical protein